MVQDVRVNQITVIIPKEETITNLNEAFKTIGSVLFNGSIHLLGLSSVEKELNQLRFSSLMSAPIAIISALLWQY